MHGTFILKRLTGSSDQEEGTLNRYILNIATRNLEVGMVQKYDKLEERINEFMESNEGAKISYQLYNKDQNLALILAIVTPVMQRVHLKVIGKLVFPKKLNKLVLKQISFQVCRNPK